MHTLRFETLHEYDAGDKGITPPVELKCGGQSVKALAKLDTGATFCIFQRERGEESGLDVEGGAPERISTPTGDFIAYGHSVSLAALGFELDVIVYFAAFPNFPRNVLGRYGFLQRLKLGLVDYEGRLYVGRYGDAM
jgi:hypothetical protein